MEMWVRLRDARSFECFYEGIAIVEPGKPWVIQPLGLPATEDMDVAPRAYRLELDPRELPAPQGRDRALDGPVVEVGGQPDDQVGAGGEQHPSPGGLRRREPGATLQFDEEQPSSADKQKIG